MILIDNKNSGVVVIESSKEKNEKLKKRWTTVNEISNSLTGISTSGFVVSLLSPFDFEGPVIEMITAALAGIGFVMKKVSESKLEKLNIKDLLDDVDKKTLVTVTENFGKIKSSKSR